MNDVQNSPGKSKLHSVVLSLLVGLTIFALGGLVATILINRLLVAQVKVYEIYSMTSASTVINLIDDMAPYLAGYIVGFSVLLLVTVGVWALSALPAHARRYGVVVLAIVFVCISMWLFGGRRTDMEVIVQMTPTLMP